MKAPRCCFCASQAGPLVGVPLLPCRPSDDERQPRLLVCLDVDGCSARMGQQGLTPLNEVPRDAGRATLARVFSRAESRRAA